MLGKLLRVDLTEEKIWEEGINESILKKFIGQIGVGIKILYDEVLQGGSGYDPENRLIFMTGPFTGTTLQSPSNYMVITKNPVTNTIAVANSHGYWGPRLKFAGFDGVVIQGKARKPVYLWIHDGKYEIRGGGSIWGKDTFETEDLVRKEIGEDRASVACIGPAGENLCAGAMINNDKGHIASKGNIGAVMGSKRLKAIAVCGTEKVPVKEPDRFSELAKEWRKKSFTAPMAKVVHEFGTAGFTTPLHEIGDLPTKNFTTCVFPEHERLSGQYVRKTFKLRPRPCYGCSIHHCHVVEVTEGLYKGFVGEEPEYEDFAAFGSNLGISDPGAVVMLTDHVDRLGLDSNFSGAILGFAIEAFKRGVIIEKDTDGLRLDWGDEKSAKELLRRIAYREGIGDVFAMGLKKAADRIGRGATNFLVHIKGEPHRSHDCRALWGMFLGFCITGSGTRWESMGVDLLPDPEIGYPECQERFSLEGKAEAARGTQIKKLFYETLGVCWFGVEVGLDLIVRAYTSLTGLPLSVEEALLIGERVANMQRAFNVRHGYLPEYDLDVSPRLLEPPPDGGAKGKTIEPHLKNLVHEYYRLMGWDEKTGKPFRKTLERVGLEEIAREFWGMSEKV
jgi:aldehyde:ferredoxin oxidoreductase